MTFTCVFKPLLFIICQQIVILHNAISFDKYRVSIYFKGNRILTYVEEKIHRLLKLLEGFLPFLFQ